MIFCLFAVVGASIQFSHHVGDWIALRIAYGSARVLHERLHIVKNKPEVLVSNGDRLDGTAVTARDVVMIGGFFLLMGAGWFLIVRAFPNRADSILSHLRLGIVLRPLFGVLIIALLGCEIFFLASAPFVESLVISASLILVSLSSAWASHILLTKFDR